MRRVFFPCGGFVVGWFAKEFLSQGNQDSTVDNKPLNEWSQVFSEATNTVRDLSNLNEYLKSTTKIDAIYNLAADMRSLGCIEKNTTAYMNSAKPGELDTNVLLIHYWRLYGKNKTPKSTNIKSWRLSR